MARINDKQLQAKYSSSVLHDASEVNLICLFGAQETFLVIFSVENFVLLNNLSKS